MAIRKTAPIYPIATGTEMVNKGGKRAGMKSQRMGKLLSREVNRGARKSK